MSKQLLVFSIESRRYAIHVSTVERVVRAVEVVPLPSAPEIVLGVIDVHGRVIPVIDVRKRFRLQEHEVNPSDQMIIANTPRRTVVLTVDRTEGVVELENEAITPARNILPDMKYIEGVIRLEDGLILIHDLDAFLSLDEEAALDAVTSTVGIAAGAGRQERKT